MMGSHSYHSAAMSPCESQTSRVTTPQLLRPRGADSSQCRTPIPAHKKQQGDFVFAIDSASTKLKIPIQAIEPSQALEEDGLVPGLCRLYLSGGCRQSQRCFQVHANPSVVHQLREEARKKPSCCHIHGAACTYDGFPLGLTVTVVKDSLRFFGSRTNSFDETELLNSAADAEGNIVLSLHHLSPTSYLWKQYKRSGSMHLIVPSQKICRDHLKGLCRFGDECNFLHGCRRLLAEIDDHLRSADGLERFIDSPSLNGSWNEHGRALGSFTDPSAQTTHGCSFNIMESFGTSASSRNAMLNSATGEAKLLKPLARHSVAHCSVSTNPATSFSHNPYSLASY